MWVREGAEAVECFARVPKAEAVWVQGEARCPCCGWQDKDMRSFALWSRQANTTSHTVTGAALCAKCAQPVGGDLVVELDTIFGREEDERVLNGRPRVYG
mgnify:CR=1 FL=1